MNQKLVFILLESFSNNYRGSAILMTSYMKLQVALFLLKLKSSMTKGLPIKRNSNLYQRKNLAIWIVGKFPKNISLNLRDPQRNLASSISSETSWSITITNMKMSAPNKLASWLIMRPLKIQYKFSPRTFI